MERINEIFEFDGKKTICIKIKKSLNVGCYKCAFSASKPSISNLTFNRCFQCSVFAENNKHKRLYFKKL